MFILIRRATKSYFLIQQSIWARAVPRKHLHIAQTQNIQISNWITIKIQPHNQKRDLNRKCNRQKEQYPNFCFVLCKVLFKHGSHKITIRNLDISTERLLDLQLTPLFYFFLSSKFFLPQKKVATVILFFLFNSIS